MTDQKLAKYSPSKFLHIYNQVSFEFNAATFSQENQKIKDISVARTQQFAGFHQ